MYGVKYLWEQCKFPSWSSTGEPEHVPLAILLRVNGLATLVNPFRDLENHDNIAVGRRLTTALGYIMIDTHGGSMSDVPIARL